MSAGAGEGCEREGLAKSDKFAATILLASATRLRIGAISLYYRLVMVPYLASISWRDFLGTLICSTRIRMGLAWCWFARLQSGKEHPAPGPQIQFAIFRETCDPGVEKGGTGMGPAPPPAHWIAPAPNQGGIVAWRGKYGQRRNEKTCSFH